MATIKDVANAAGVSPATVSAVLNDSAFVSPALKARVLDAIRDLDYAPSQLARNLRRGHSELIAIVVAERIDQAKDAVEAIDIAFTPRPSVSNLREATRHGAPSLWTEAAGNVAGMFEIGDAAAVDNIEEFRDCWGRRWKKIEIWKIIEN